MGGQAALQASLFNINQPVYRKGQTDSNRGSSTAVAVSYNKNYLIT